ncbi:MAG: TolC family protein [Deferribacterales bacterium]
MILRLTALMLMVPCFLFAADVRTLTLDEAVNIAMEKNKSIASAREYINYLQGVYVEERAAALPNASVYGKAFRNKDESTGSYVGSDTFNSYSAGITVKQALFTWGQVGAAIKVAQIGLKTGDEQLRMYKQATVRDVKVAFTDILLTKKLLEIAESNVRQRERHYDEAKKKYDLGTATDYDVLSAKVALKNAYPDVITYKNDLVTARDRLRFILSIEGDIDVTGSLEQKIYTAPDYDSLMKTASDNRPELRDKRLMTDVYREMIKIDSAGDKPRVDLSGGYDSTRLEGDDDKTLNTWNVGVTLSFNFFDGLKTSGKRSQAVSNLRRSKLDELNTEDSVALDIRQAISRVKEAAEIIDAAEGTVDEASKLLDMAEKGFKFGVKTKLEVDDAEYNLRSAQVRLARAYRDYSVQYTNLLWSAGVLGEKEELVKK